MVMSRDIIVAKMVIIAEQNNEEAMKSSGMDAKSMSAMKDQVRSQLFKIQGDILDALVEEGLITIN
jgi:hypothetical protein